MVKCRECMATQNQGQRGEDSFNPGKHFALVVPKGNRESPSEAWKDFVLCPNCHKQLTEALSESDIGLTLSRKYLSAVDAMPPA